MHECQPWSHCQGRAWAVVASVSNPSLLLKGGKTGQSSHRVARVTFFLAVVLSQPLSWQGLCAGSWGTLYVPAPGCPCPGPPSSTGPPAVRCSWEGAGGSQTQGWGDSRTLEEPCRDEK